MRGGRLILGPTPQSVFSRAAARPVSRLRAVALDRQRAGSGREHAPQPASPKWGMNRYTDFSTCKERGVPSDAVSWYDAHARELSSSYEALRTEELYGWLAGLLPEPPAVVIDIGAGTGRDAAHWRPGASR